MAGDRMTRQDRDLGAFHQLRLWLTEAPLTERRSVALAIVVIVALLTWAAVPFGSDHSRIQLGQSRSGVGPGAPESSGSAGPGGGVGGGSPASNGTFAPGAGGATPGGLAGAGPSNEGSASSGDSQAGGPGPAGSRCGPLTNTDKGVSAAEILIGVDIVDLGQLNGTLNLPTYQEQQNAYNAIFAYYNQNGGAQCRKLVPKYYDDMIADPTSEQNDCLQMAQDGVFAVLNNFFNFQTINCVAQQHIPNVWYTPPHAPTLKQFYPYILSDAANYDRVIRNYVLGAKQEGFFAGLRKLGILEETCYPDENTDIAKDLAEAGIKSSQIDIYNYGCPAATDSPPQDQQAVLQFQRDGVTHVMNVAYQLVTGFAQAENTQDYHPKLAIMEDAEMSAFASQNPPPASSFDGTLGITTDQVGATTTPGVAVSPATALCTQILAKIGYPGPTQDPHQSLAGTLYGSGCAVIKFLIAAIQNDTPLVRTGLPAGIARAGKVDLSYPAGPMNITSASDPTGGQYWRADRWSSACECWHVVDQTFHDSF